MRQKSAARFSAVCAVMTALLIAVQYALGFLPGVELVTALLLAFCYVFGVRHGMTVATAFSLVRCLLFGFYPNVLLLYLVYFNAFALLFGLLGARQKPVAVWVCPVLVALLAAGCLAGALAELPVSILMRGRLAGMFWALFGTLAAILALYVVLAVCGGRVRSYRESASLAALAALCCVFFTLLDDVITPLWYGYSADAALAYFYAGFFAMLPQTVCAAVSVLILFEPLRRVFVRAAAGAKGRAPRLHPQSQRKLAPDGENAASNDGRTQKDVV